MFWVSLDNSTILDINVEKGIWIFYQSGAASSTIYKYLDHDDEYFYLTCENKWCKDWVSKDTLATKIEFSEDTLSLDMGNEVWNFKMLPVFEEIDWDSIYITKGYDKGTEEYHATLYNDRDVDHKSKTIMAWMLHNKPFRFTYSSYKDRGYHGKIILDLYKNDQIIAMDSATMLFFDLDFEQDLGFYK